MRNAILAMLTAGQEVLQISATEGAKLGCEPTVLIVDRCEETHDVLQTVLERRGVRTLAARNVAAGSKLAQQHRPDVIVLDAELDETLNGELPGASFLTRVHRPAANRPQMILLGKLRRRHGVPFEGEVVAKPYHYAPLIRKIEELLAASGQAKDNVRSRAAGG